MLPDNIFFISDTHFSHKNIIDYEDRTNYSSLIDYSSVEDMNQDIIKIWNTHISPDSIVFHLGDFCFGNAVEWVRILEQLNGAELHLIKGNHDKPTKNVCSYFTSVSAYKEITLTFYDEKIPIILSHYPMVTWNRSHYGSWQLFGHVHKAFKFNPYAQNSVNVGWDVWNKPISATELASIFYKSR